MTKAQAVSRHVQRVKRRYALIQRTGLNAVERMVLRLGWIFREQPIADFGIDALVEICEHDRPTGRLIALQIKSGGSYFKERSSDGFVFRGSKAHLDYWLGYSLPVLVVLYHPERDEAWWCAIEARCVERTPKAWCVKVPDRQRFDESSRLAIEALTAADFKAKRSLVDLSSLFDPSSSTVRLPTLLDALATAQHQIDVASPYIDEKLFWALSGISRRRIRVRLITGIGLPECLRHEVSSQDHVHLGWRTVTHLHEKMVAIDRKFAISTSSNFTVYGWRNPWETVSASFNEELVSVLCRSFDKIWSASTGIDWPDENRG